MPAADNRPWTKAPGNAPEMRTRRMALPKLSPDMAEEDLDKMVDNATAASNFLKAISHEGRLMILCHLVTGEKSVTELEELLSARQAAVSQQLSRLRLEGLVIPRRDGKAIYYRLADNRPRRVLELVYDLFCGVDEDPQTA
jgi:DNA-binding transcriptional ArsR family regulator